MVSRPLVAIRRRSWEEEEEETPRIARRAPLAEKWPSIYPSHSSRPKPASQSFSKSDPLPPILEAFYLSKLDGWNYAQVPTYPGRLSACPHSRSERTGTHGVGANQEPHSRIGTFSPWGIHTATMKKKMKKKNKQTRHEGRWQPGK
jgi:hypothetical protein